MKVNFKVNEKLSVELDAKNVKDAFEQIAGVQEVFDQYCPIDKSVQSKLKYRVRVVTKDKKEYKYYEMYCPITKAKLAFGVHLTGESIFPKRKDEEGNWIADGGWSVWKPGEESKED